MIPSDPMVCRKSLVADEATSASMSKPAKNARNVHFIALNRKKCSTNISANRSIVEESFQNKKLSLDNNGKKYETVAETKPNTCYNSVANTNTHHPADVPQIAA